MATSTRHKIKEQWEAAVKALDNCHYHLMYISTLAGTDSEPINKTLPAVIYGLEQMKEVLAAFREAL